MTTIDNIMALALNYRLAGSASRDEHEEALRAALAEALPFQPDWADFRNGRECGRLEATEALAKDVSIINEGNKAQPVQEPSCETCKHCTVSSQNSFEETCFICSHYYDSKYEAKK